MSITIEHNDRAESKDEPAKLTVGVRKRVILLGIVAATLTSVLVTQAEIVLSTVRIGYLSLPPAALAMLLIVMVLNAIVKRFLPKASLSTGDILVIYCMCLVSAMVSSHGVVQKLVPLLVIPKYYADNSNNWHGLYDPHIPKQLVPYNVTDGKRQSVVDDYYNSVHIGAHIPWDAWVTPILAWGLLIGLVLFAFLCITTILRKQWVDNEKLSFPLAQIPLDLVGGTSGEGQHPGKSIFTNPALWAGIAIPVVVYALKGLHNLEPTVPDITLTWSPATSITTPPWSAAANGVVFSLSFAAIGLFFLLPTDILLSIWFFYILTRLEVAAASAYNIDLVPMPQFPPPLFVGYQTMGAYIVLALYFAWTGRKHYKMVWEVAIGRRQVDDSNELIPYRVAVWGLIGSVIAAAAWLIWAGMSPWLAILELVMGIFVIGLVMARTTVESGFLMTETTFRPINFYQLFGSLHGLGATNLTLVTFVDSIFMRDQRDLLLCGFMDSAKISDGSTVSRRSFTFALVIGVITAFVVACLLNIYLPYHLGALKMDSWIEQGNSRWTFSDTSAFSGSQVGSSGTGLQMYGGFVIGLAVTIALTVLRSVFFWWPLHPLGYALSGSWGTTQFWFPCLIAYILKAACIRYGGRPLYMNLRPVFLGLVVGEFGMAVLAVVLNLLFHLPVPQFPWG